MGIALEVRFSAVRAFFRLDTALLGSGPSQNKTVAYRTKVYL